MEEPIKRHQVIRGGSELEHSGKAKQSRKKAKSMKTLETSEM